MTNFERISRHGGLLYFDIHFEEYNLEEDLGEHGEHYHLKGEYSLEDLENGNAELTQELLELEWKALRGIERDLREVLDKDSLFPRSVHNEGHDYLGVLVCKIYIKNLEELKKVNEYISSNHIGGDDEIGSDAPYHTIRGFMFFPNGLSNTRIDSRDWEEYFEDYDSLPELEGDNG